MGKLRKQFEFTTHLRTGNGANDQLHVLVTGRYYPDKCDADELVYDIEEMYEVQQHDSEIVKLCNLTGLFRVAEYNECRISDNIHDATKHHIQYLLQDNTAHIFQITTNALS